MGYLQQIFLGQYDASLAMLHDCIAACPAGQWDGKIARYPFWQTAYHTLCYADYYLSRDEAAFVTRPDLHPRGMDELGDEYPSRRFEPGELTRYALLCRDKARTAIPQETDEILRGPCGFARRGITRGELHIYNIRHIQHHTGQLGAFLRRVDEAFQTQSALRWIGTGWPA